MPYVQDPNLEEDENEQDPSQVQISGASSTTEGDGESGAPPQAAGAGTTAAAPKKALNTGSGFQNLDKYLKTNQSQAFGNQVLGKVGNEVQGAQQNQQQASQKFTDQVSNLNQTPTNEQVTQAIADPQSANKEDFQKWMNQSYQGPKNLQDSSDLWNQYWSGSNKANTSAQQLGTEAGRFSLLDSYFGKPNYSFGEKSLDNLLVQQSGLGRETKQLQNQATQLQSQGAQGAQNLQNMASQKAASVDQSRQGVLNAIGVDEKGNILSGDQAGAIGKEYGNINTELQQTNAQRQQQADAFRQQLASTGNLSTAQLQQLGIAPGQSIYNLDLNNYVKYGGDLNANQVANPEERARIQALSQLAGVDDMFGNLPVEAASQAFSLDTGRLTQDAAQAKNQYQNALQNQSVMLNGQMVPLAEVERQYQQEMTNIAQMQEAQRQAKMNANGRFGAGDEYSGYLHDRPIYANAVLDILNKGRSALDAQYQTGRNLGI